MIFSSATVTTITALAGLPSLLKLYNRSWPQPSKNPSPFQEAKEFVEEKANDGTNIFEQMVVMLKYALRKDKDKLTTLFTNEFQKAAKRDGQYSHIAAQVCAIAGLNKEAIDWLEISVNLEFINYPFFSEYDPSMKNLREENRFQKLMEQVKREWLEFIG